MTEKIRVLLTHIRAGCRWATRHDSPAMIVVAIVVAVTGGLISFKTFQIARDSNRLVEQQNQLIAVAYQPDFDARIDFAESTSGVQQQVLVVDNVGSSVTELSFQPFDFLEIIPTPGHVSEALRLPIADYFAGSRNLGAGRTGNVGRFVRESTAIPAEAICKELQGDQEVSSASNARPLSCTVTNYIRISYRTADGVAHQDFLQVYGNGFQVIDKLQGLDLVDQWQTGGDIDGALFLHYELTAGQIKPYLVQHLLSGGPTPTLIPTAALLAPPPWQFSGDMVIRLTPLAQALLCSLSL